MSRYRVVDVMATPTFMELEEVGRYDDFGAALARARESAKSWTESGNLRVERFTMDGRPNRTIVIGDSDFGTMVEGPL